MGGLGTGLDGGKGFSTSLPGSGLTQVCSGPQGRNQMTSAPGGLLQTWDPVRPPTTGLSRVKCDSRKPRLYWGDSPVEQGGSQRAPVPSHPSPPLAMGLPRYGAGRVSASLEPAYVCLYCLTFPLVPGSFLSQ